MRHLSILALLSVLTCVPTAQPRASAFPELIPLPDGFQPEGVTLGNGDVVFVGSLADGSIYRADLRTGEGAILVPAATDRIAVGVDFDNRANRLFVAGGPAGAAYVYDVESGESVAEYPLTQAESFVNDVIVTTDAAYFTDSFQPVVYRLPLGPGGRLPDPGAVQALPFSGEFSFVAGAVNSNGIEASANGEWLVIADGPSAALYRVDPMTGESRLIDLGGQSLANGDGLVLEGRTLYVVQNALNQISVVELGPDLTTGSVVDVLTSPNFDVPSTAASFGNALYAVNARFGTPPTPDTEYDIVRVLK